MTKSFVTGIFILLSLNLFAKGEPNKKSKGKPNIIYILLDDLGYGDVSTLNPESKIKTPNIDTFREQGMSFTDAHTSSSVCTPTRYGIITGRYNWRSPLKGQVLQGTSKALIPTSRKTVAQMLKDNGYYTGFIGKWHLGWDWGIKEGVTFDPDAKDPNQIDFSKPVTNGPKELGFDYSYGVAASTDFPPYVYVENGKILQAPSGTSKAKGDDRYGWFRTGPIADNYEHTDVTPNFFRRGQKFVKEHAKDKKPFFLYLPIPAPHTPILPVKEWQGKSGLNPYADFVMMIDWYIGEFMKSVKEAGIEDNTLIVFTSDNGCSRRANYKLLAEKGHHPSYIFKGEKTDIFDGGHRVPFIVRWPKEIKANSEYKKLICTTDFMATCADIVDYKLQDNEGEDSFTMLPALKGGEMAREDVIHHSGAGMFAIRTADWKMIFTNSSGGRGYPTAKDAKKLSLPKYQLYNMKDDVSEKVNLYQKKPEVEKSLANRIGKIINDGRSTEGKKQANDKPLPGKAWKQIKFLDDYGLEAPKVE